MQRPGKELLRILPAAVPPRRKTSPLLKDKQNHMNSGDAAGPAALWTFRDSLSRSLHRTLSSFSGRRGEPLGGQKGEEDCQKVTVLGRRCPRQRGEAGAGGCAPPDTHAWSGRWLWPGAPCCQGHQPRAPAGQGYTFPWDEPPGHGAALGLEDSHAHGPAP